jgi:hypothetical protein
VANSFSHRWLIFGGDDEEGVECSLEMDEEDEEFRGGESVDLTSFSGRELVVQAGNLR